MERYVTAAERRLEATVDQVDDEAVRRDLREIQQLLKGVHEEPP